MLKRGVTVLCDIACPPYVLHCPGHPVFCVVVSVEPSFIQPRPVAMSLLFRKCLRFLDLGWTDIKSVKFQIKVTGFHEIYILYHAPDFV
jgi:hypothetical protein